ncbi:MAG: DinB family protein, partial [Planctomycetes bacterium]|nr:DinB family protein [Planctomycetota bacterium]
MSNSAAFAPFFQIHQLLGAAAVDGLTAEQWATPPAEGCNHPVWILAHIVGVRRSLARNLGHDIPHDDWETQADFGGELLPADSYPAPAALMTEYASLGK